MKIPAIYVMMKERNGALHVGVTSNLIQRVYQHKQGLVDGFTKKHGLKTLVYFEVYDDMIAAISREKQIKAGSRKRKMKLIESMNSNWKDLYETII